MVAEKFIKNKTVLITLLSACVIVMVSLGIRQTFGMFYFDFATDLNITLSQFGFALGLQMLLWEFLDLGLVLLQISMVDI